MIRPILGTFLTRAWTTGSSLLVIMVAGHALGTEGLGVISLVVLGITIVQLVNNLVGGGALVYLAPRAPRRELLWPAYAWALITAGLAGVGLHLAADLGNGSGPTLVPEGYGPHVVVLALMQSLYNVHLNLLVGHQHLRTFNRITALQGLVLLVAFIMAIRLPGPHDAHRYVQASYAAFGTTLLLSTIALLRVKAPALLTAEENVLRRMVRQGTQIQTANLLQLLNYRLAYYLIETFRGLSALGVYSVANQLAEGAWLAPRSLGLVLYSTVSNTEEQDRQRDLTLALMKLAVLAATVVIAVLLVLPGVLYSTLFGPEIVGLFPLIALLAPGIIAMSASQAFSHFYSGTGRNRHNAIGSLLGTVMTIGAGLLLIPRYGLHGAALTASLAYGANAIYQLIVFLRITQGGAADLWITRQDLERGRTALARGWNARR
ncbi:MAG: polysaccharide biosynthesis C-terminal domain-containing protein [Flavobacteriales bacterium]|nr:polysaccharide biosynthesis C-terminal domain-containing protein [Flavobacteriales bacterium]MCB9168105.1 polysaccharide biosynthesis C-terminal domain-containing protein [Flavobacteriales bacterium]